MKKIFKTVAFLLASAYAFAQAPQSFNYQGLARDNAGTAMATKTISVKATILDGTATGTSVYSETFSASTNAFGLFTLGIGSGTPVAGTFSAIKWSSGNKFLKIEIDPNGGSSYALSGTTQLLSVPYAMYAASAGDSKWTDATGGINYNGGKVGIGTSTPTNWLEIQKNATGVDRGFVHLLNTNNGEDCQTNVKIASGTGSNEGYLMLSSSAKSYFPALTDRAGKGIVLSEKLTLESRSTNSDVTQAYISFWTGGSWTGSADPVERVRIDYAGNIGIGTKTPKSKLQITSGDVYLDDATKGIIMKNTAGQCYRVTVGTAGALVSTLITCP